jgi:hypothetical protein
VSGDYKRLDVTPAVHEGEWTVCIQVTGLEVAFLSPFEAKDLSQRLFHLALEISEREGQPQGGETVEQLRAQLRKETQKRQELARKVAPKDKLEAAKRALRVAIGTAKEDGAGGFAQHHEGGEGVAVAQFEAALAWLEEFKA